MSSFGNAPGMHLQDLILDTRTTATKEQKIACLKTLRIVVKNLADPQKSADPKYRQLKLSNPKVNANLTPCNPSAIDYMKAIGFAIVRDNDDEYLRIDSSKSIATSHMEASLFELNNAIDMLSPKDVSGNNTSFSEEKKTAEGNTTNSNSNSSSSGMLRSQSSTLSTASTSSSSATGTTRMSEKQKARELMEKKRQREAEEAKAARQRTSNLIKQDKYVRENDENWTSKQSAACVKSGTGINTFRDKYGEN